MIASKLGSSMRCLTQKIAAPRLPGLVGSFKRPFCQVPSQSADDEIDFVQRDFDEMREYDYRLQYDPSYLKIMDKWQKPLEQKQRRKERIAKIKEAFVGVVNYRFLQSTKKRSSLCTTHIFLLSILQLMKKFSLWLTLPQVNTKL